MSGNIGPNAHEDEIFDALYARFLAALNEQADAWEAWSDEFFAGIGFALSAISPIGQTPEQCAFIASDAAKQAAIDAAGGPLGIWEPDTN